MAAAKVPQEGSTSSIASSASRAARLTFVTKAIKGGYMKKTYTAPTTTVNGGVIRETMGNGIQSVEGGGFQKSPDGSVGFHL